MPSIINSDDGVVSGSSGLKTTGGNDGILNLQSNGTTIAALSGGAFQVGGNNISAQNSMGFRNRIINGDMRIDQRNAGASVTPTNSQYLLDRFYALLTQASKFTVQRNAGSVTPPVGFKNYLGVTSSSAYSIVSTDIFAVAQGIEGFNVADLDWGTANAATVTLSFRVYSSLTGTFGGSLRNAANTRAYPFSYTVSSANTWTTVSVVIPGDTTGTWATDNTAGIYLSFGLGVGSTYSAAAGSWTGTASIFSATGSTSVVATNGATFYITGVQLEAGSVATPFERRPYGTELALCQRYFFSVNAIGTSGTTVATTKAMFTLRPPVTMRSAPTVTYANQGRITYPTVVDYEGTYFGESRTITPDSIGFFYTQSSGSTFTQNVPVALNDISVSCVITGSAEL